MECLVCFQHYSVDQQRYSPPLSKQVNGAFTLRHNYHTKLHIHRANIMKVKCTFLAKIVYINAFNGVTMLLFPPIEERCPPYASVQASLLSASDVGSSSTLVGYRG
jgi:hypothetical protein